MINLPYIQPLPRHRELAAGFTMVEMLVAVAGTLILVMFLSQIFQTMSAATSAGRATSSIIQNMQAMTSFDNPIRRDAEEMLGPGPRENGILVIINRLIPGNLDGDPIVEPVDGEQNLKLTAESEQAVIPGLRSDQVVWIRNTSGEQPRAPGAVFQYGTVSDAPFLRVWYGHVLRTDPNGTGPAVIAPNIEPADLGHQGPNLYATAWILGRQALFLDDDLGGGVHANGGWYDAPVKGFGAGASTNKPPFSVVPGPGSEDKNENNGPLFMGTTDIAYFGYSVDAEANSNGDAPNGSGAGQWGYDRGAMVGGVTAAEVNRNPDNSGRNPDYARPRLYTDLDVPTYRDRAYLYTFGFERLRTNPEPATAADPYKPWQVGQMHAFLADHVIDFRVQFAGDYRDDIVGPDGATDTWDHDNNTATPELIRWYDIDAGAGAATKVNGLLAVDTGTAQCFRRNGGAANVQPIYDDRAHPSIPPHVDRAYIFRHGAGLVNNWPYMLRFQYRVIDPQGKLIGADGRPGKLFEVIVRVNRD